MYWPYGAPAHPSSFPRFAQLSEELKQEGQAREAACGSLRQGQEEAGQKVELDMARMQVSPKSCPCAQAFPSCPLLLPGLCS